MIDTLRLLRSRQLKRSKLTHKNSGFTLIELMVAMVLAILVITPLLDFMVNIMDNDRTEQAKATSEQEIQSAIDYISHDLQEAVYIYDADGIAAIKNQLPSPTATDRVPVLVFWKRNYYRKVVPVSTTSTCPPPTSATSDNCNDAFVYSLVAYYLIKDNNSIWSSAARIGRFEIKDGVKNPNSSTGTGYLSSYSPDSGFKLFDLTLQGTLKNKMNAWTKDSSTPYTVDILPLVDYIDQSTTLVPPDPTQSAYCTSTTSSDAKLIPATTANPLNIYSFYACVDSSRTLAQVYIRGNALARIVSVPTVPPTTPPTYAAPTYTTSKSTYFPTAIIQIQGRGLLGG